MDWLNTFFPNEKDLFKLTSSRCDDFNIGLAVANTIDSKHGYAIQSVAFKLSNREARSHNGLLRLARPFHLALIDATGNGERHRQAAILACSPGESERRL